VSACLGAVESPTPALNGKVRYVAAAPRWLRVGRVGSRRRQVRRSVPSTVSVSQVSAMQVALGLGTGSSLCSTIVNS